MLSSRSHTPSQLPTKYPNTLVNTCLQYDLARFFLLKRLFNKSAEEERNGPIPKVIHYCWFGRTSMPDWRKKNLESWKKFLPEYKIVRWDESNFPIELYSYAQEAYSKGIYAFVADVARLHAVYNYGGIYLDTNNEIIRSHPFDDLLSVNCFASFEAPTQITIQTFGAVKNHPFTALLLDFYKFVHLRPAYRYVANVRYISKIVRLFYKEKLEGKRLVLSDGTVILPRELFTPKTVTNETRIFHHFGGSWGE